MNLSVILLAAGQGTRMKSSLPKVLHRVCGQPMAQYALNTARQITDQKPVLVIGHGAEQVRDVLGDQCDYVIQSPQLGTGHAVLQARDLLRARGGRVLVCYADMPLLTIDSFQRLIAQRDNTIAMLTVITHDPRGFGRIARQPNGDVQAIIEDAQATPEQKMIRELNVGLYSFEAEFLWSELPTLPLSPKGEYYLTDLVAVAVSQHKRVVAITTDDLDEAIGVNTRVHLAECETVMRKRINRRWMEAGVTMIDPATTLIESSATLSADAVILPNTQIIGRTVIGGNTVIGPNTHIADSKIGSHCKVFSSVVEEATIEDHVEIGPYAHLRKGAHLASGVHLGNFGEVKNSYLGAGVRMGHFSYIGDAKIGANTNIGAGTITCNYDGERKNETIVGDDVFIGSDTMLVAPITLGNRSRTGAGSVVTKNVPDDSLAVGIPARIRKK
jgi:bifunctional UDP-N-acetylglucosamine pyrophosphorylase/glucosamine-1-phosphate N-acetyltransferase